MAKRPSERPFQNVPPGPNARAQAASRPASESPGSLPTKVATGWTREPRAASAAMVGAISAVGVEMSKSIRTTLGRSWELTRASQAAAEPELIPTVNAFVDDRALETDGASGTGVLSAQPPANTAMRRAASRTRTKQA